MSLNKEQLEVLNQLFSNLDENQKKDFIKNLGVKDSEKGSKETNSYETKDEFLKARKQVEVCPFCHSEHIVKNGKVKGVQRFLCKDCLKTFGYTENTILKHSQFSMNSLIEFIHCMVEKKSLRETAKLCNMSLPTAFKWRHRILDSLQNMQDNVSLNGIVESDETFTSISYKGNHANSNFKMPRNSNHRGAVATLRGLSKQKVCLSCFVNHNGLSIGGYSNLGKPKWTEINKVLNNRIEEGSVFVTDSYRGYSKLSYDKNLNHIAIPRNKHTIGVFNIQLINNYHKRLKEMINRTFNGVATKYINNYIVYHNLVNFAKGTKEEKENTMLNFVFTTDCKHVIKDNRLRPAIPA